MATFITLTKSGISPERINADRIVRYYASNDGSRIDLGNVHDEWYSETPAEIDALLGVTESDRARLVSLVDRVLTSPAALNRPWEWDEREAWISEAQKAVRAARGE
ncbi:hypothetical protein TSA6c_00290 [Azospirillum sp. TSA6c]|uniref:hypothetical protein n=1 Tax=Azospirillum sp. TSA6c TaxID=709813 RepID=UPI000D611C4F|nr:hypothetical protein [Azospirillum sp. TSA6c]PWC54402.1 hypothetical protein TSA6c_00290 [Azospirillum sp. TSA6c]